jgi:excisionase family DNA binding protein
MISQTDEWLTIAEACRRLKVTRATLYRWARRGRLRLFRLGERTTRLRREDVEALLQEISPTLHVTVVGHSGYKVLALGPGVRTVKDAVAHFESQPEGNLAVFVNQEPCDDLDRVLEAGDLILMMSRDEIETSKRVDWSEEERQAWLVLAESSFNKDWDNPSDAIYDDWKELYGVRDR